MNIYARERNLSVPFSISRMHISNGQDVNFQVYGSMAPTHVSKGSRFGLHKHSHYELIYVLDGEFTQHFENGFFHYRKGDACLLNRNIHHCEGFESDCQIIFINMQPEFLHRLFSVSELYPDKPQYIPGTIQDFAEENMNRDSGTDAEYIDCAQTLEQQMNGNHPIEPIILSMIRELTEASTGYVFRLQAFMLELLEILENADLYHLTRIRVDSRSEDFIYSRLVRYLEERHGHATREELGRILHYNGDYLNRIVKHQSGLTISQLGQKICMKEARRLLAESSMNISGIITHLGYTNRSHFYQLFEKETGMSPMQYRKQQTKL